MLWTKPSTTLRVHYENGPNVNPRGLTLFIRLAVAWVYCGVLIAPIVAFGDSEGRQPDEKANRDVQLDIKNELPRKLWSPEFLINSNDVPVIKDNGSGAIFSSNYRWVEQTRVVDAIKKISKESSEDIWFALVSAKDDKRYCLTLKDNYCSSWEDVSNWSVGKICFEIAKFQVRVPSVEAIGNFRSGEKSLANSIFSELPLDPVPGKGLVYNQIYYCERALAYIIEEHNRGRIEKSSSSEFKSCKKRLEDSIESLKRNLKPQFGIYTFPGERFSLFRENSEKRNLDSGNPSGNFEPATNSPKNGNQSEEQHRRLLKAHGDASLEKRLRRVGLSNEEWDEINK